MDSENDDLDDVDFSEYVDNLDEDVVYQAAYGTTHLKGTDGKVEVMAARYALGLPLWHDDDAVILTADDDVPDTYNKRKEIYRCGQ